MPPNYRNCLSVHDPFDPDLKSLIVDFNLNSDNNYTSISASARISKGQGYRGFLRKRAGSSFGQKRAICVVQGKTDRILLLSG
jgi:hypothetical protein